MLPNATIGRNRNKRGQHANPERLYKEAAAARKVKQYLDLHWSKIIKDEDRLISVSKNLEPPPGITPILDADFPTEKMQIQ